MSLGRDGGPYSNRILSRNATLRRDGGRRKREGRREDGKVRYSLLSRRQHAEEIWAKDVLDASTRLLLVDSLTFEWDSKLFTMYDTEPNRN